MSDITIDQITTHTFYQVPQIFMTTTEKEYDKTGKLKYKVRHTSKYAELSNDTKLAYAGLYNRCQLSIQSYKEGKTDYVDENGSVFLVYTVEDLMDLLGVKKTRLHQIKKELQEAGLLREVRQGANRPNRLYLQNVDASLQRHERFEISEDKRGHRMEKHVQTLDYLGQVIFELSTEAAEDKNGGSENERPTNGFKSTKNGSSENERPENEPQDVQIMNGTKNDITNIELLDNSSRKAEKISEEISQPSRADLPPAKNQSEKYIQPQYYSLLQVIADKYDDRFIYPAGYTLTHKQKMQIGEYLSSGFVLSQEVLNMIDRIPADCQSPLAYLMTSIENLKQERLLEAKIAAHRQAEGFYQAQQVG